MTNFKQIIGRGTRVLEERGKYWFTIIDYVGATQLFYDPAFDGDPVRVTKTKVDNQGNEVEIQDSEDGTLVPETEATPGKEPVLPEIPEHQISELPRKYYLDGISVYIIGEQAYELDPQENVLRTVQFTDYVAENVRRLSLSAEHLQRIWPLPEQRAEILNELRARGIDSQHLAQVTHHPEADALDLLLHVAYNAPIVSRQERAEKLRQQKQNFFNTFMPAAREILNILLEKYADFGIGEWENLTSVLSVPPFSELGTPLEITQRFGGPLEMRQAVNQMQQLLYEE